MSTTYERPPDDSAATLALLTSGGLDSSPANEADVAAATLTQTLGALPLGAHLILRCRKDWRTATVVRIEPDKITLSVSSPTGRTYRMRRPPDAPLTFHGQIPLLDAGKPSCWRAGLARYDVRW
ncbi:MAG TPA: hypothetical protein VGO96_10965 [Pyrinomonadaceae bacterium]|nr:hypothetical protein [Pyrinomonadaceae bacterium]